MPALRRESPGGLLAMPIDPAMYAAANRRGGNSPFATTAYRPNTANYKPGGAFGGGSQSGGGNGNSLFQGFGAQQQTNYGSQDLGSRRLDNSSVNWNAFANIGNALDQNPAMAGYLRSMGAMPSYNGVALDQRTGPDSLVGKSYSAPGSSLYTHRQIQNRMTPGIGGWMDGGSTGTPAMGGQWSSFGANPTTVARPASAPGGFDLGQFGGGGSGGMGGGSTAGNLEAQIGGAYGNLISNGGSPYSAAQRAQLVAQSQDTVNRGTEDAIQSARLDAIRRGDTSGSTVGSREDAIRARGAADSSRARLGAETQLSSQALQGLLASLGGAGNYANKRAEIETILGQLAAQQNGGGLNLMFGMGA